MVPRLYTRLVMGSGHSVTALYDVILRDDHASHSVATVRLRAKPPGPDAPAREWKTAMRSGLVHAELADTSNAFRLALGTATFAEKLRGSQHVQEISYGWIADLTRGAVSDGRGLELVGLIETAGALTGEGSVAQR